VRQIIETFGAVVLVHDAQGVNVTIGYIVRTKTKRYLFMRVDLLKVLVIVMGLGLLPMPSLVSNALAEEAKTCADGTPCPTDAELEDSCSDEGESL
jgi:hypothetical protein